MHQVFWLDFGCSQPSWWWQEAQLPPQPSPFQPPCLEIHTTASANRMTRTISVMIPRSVNIFLYLFSGRKGFRIQYTRFCPEGQRIAKRKSVIFLKLGLAFWQRPCYNNHVPVRNAQNRIKYGGLAQLVRAPASHAGGLGFESLILHQTVRTRTRFFMKKGSGTFFVYRRFCGESTRSGKQAKAGYHHGDGILPFVLRNQVRFVRTWSSPLYGAFEGNRCVRAYRRAVHLWQGVTH